MAVDKLVDSTQLDADLTSVANAIRAKGGTSAQMAFPAGFVSAIEDLSSGNANVSQDQDGYIVLDDETPSGVGEWTTEGIAMNTEPNGVVTLKNHNQNYDTGSYAFAYKPITGLIIDMNNLNMDFRMALNVFSNSNLASVAVINNSNDRSIIICNAFQSTPIESFDLPDTKINFAGYTEAFMGCQKLTRINLPRAFGGMMAPCRNCYLLSFADMGEANTLYPNGFLNCYVLQTLILRSANLVELGNVSAFNNTPLRGYNGLTATVYVPQALIDSYKAATNWSMIFNEGYLTFAAIEGSEYEI